MEHVVVSHYGRRFQDDRVLSLSRQREKSGKSTNFIFLLVLVIVMGYTALRCSQFALHDWYVCVIHDFNVNLKFSFLFI
jgi:hypothetical protein